MRRTTVLRLGLTATAIATNDADFKIVRIFLSKWTIEGAVHNKSIADGIATVPWGIINRATRPDTVPGSTARLFQKLSCNLYRSRRFDAPIRVLTWGSIPRGRDDFPQPSLQIGPFTALGSVPAPTWRSWNRLSHSTRGSSVVWY